MATRSVAFSFGDDSWRKLIAQMQASMQTPAWQTALEQMNFSSQLSLPQRIDWSAVSKTLEAQNAQTREVLAHLSSESAVTQWAEIAKQINAGVVQRDADLLRAANELRRRLAEANAPGIGDAAEYRPAPGRRATEHPSRLPGFAWIDAMPQKSQVRLLLSVLTVIALLTQATAEATNTEMPPGLANYTAALLVIATALNERVGLTDDDPHAT